MSSLDRKLFRDLRRMKWQAIAIGLVMALGVMVLVMMDGLVVSLEETKKSYYEDYKLADIFAPTQAAQSQVLVELAKIDGVENVQGRVRGSILIDMPNSKTGVLAQALSLPNQGKAQINDVFLSAGRMIAPDVANEILLLNSFADAHNIKVGEAITAIIGGQKQQFNVVGVAQAPEFLFAAMPGELLPDDTRFAVIWMQQRYLEDITGLAGKFNEAIFLLDDDADTTNILTKIDDILDPHGGYGAYGVEDLVSNRFISEEIKGAKASAQALPPLFLGIAAFLIFIVISRIIQAERQQIGLLKAFGYSSAEIGRHYLKFIIIIALGGAILGSVAGVYGGLELAGVYQIYYKFPFLEFRVDYQAIFIGNLVSVVAATIGGSYILKNIFKLNPAVAMHAATPPDFSKSIRFGSWAKRLFNQPSRMIIRTLLRHPIRALGAMIAIASGMSLSVAMISLMASFDKSIEMSFEVIDRSDAMVNFVQPMPIDVVAELSKIAGIELVEPFRAVPAILQNGQLTHKSLISGLVAAPELNRAVNVEFEAIPIVETGIILASALAEKLQVGVGDDLTLKIRSGARPTLNIKVAAITETLVGSPVYMRLASLNKILDQGELISGVYIKMDKSQQAAIYDELKSTPYILAVSITADAKAAFKKIMDTGAGAVRYVMAIIAFVITFGIVFNSAKIAFAEGGRDLACLRSIGYTKGEAAYVLLGELAIVTLVSLPIGCVLGYYLSFATATAFSTDLYKIPAEVNFESFFLASLAVVVATIVSGWLVKRNIDKIDLVSVLKSE